MTKTRLDEAMDSLFIGQHARFRGAFDARELGHIYAVLARYIPDTPAPNETTHDKLFVVGYHDPEYPDEPSVGVALDEIDACNFAFENIGGARPVNAFKAVIWKPKLKVKPMELGDVEVQA